MVYNLKNHENIFHIAMVVNKRPTSLKVDPELWEEVKIMAIRTRKNITEYFEDALREKLVKDYEVVAVERKMKEQERIHQEQVNRRYQQIVGQDPGSNIENKSQNPGPQEQEQEVQSPINKEERKQEVTSAAILQSQSGQIQLQRQKYLNIFDKDTIEPKPGEGKGGEGSKRSIEVEIELPGFSFPTNKERLMRFVQDNEDGYGIKSKQLYEIFEKLPTKKYMNVVSLEDTLIETFNHENKMNQIMGDYEVVVGCKIDVEEKIEKENLQRMLSQKYSDMLGRGILVPLEYPFTSNEYGIKLWLPGLKFPKSKDKLIQYAKELKEKRGEELPLYLFERLSNINKTYLDEFGLQEDIIEEILDNDEELVTPSQIKLNDIRKIIVNFDEDKNSIKK